MIVECGSLCSDPEPMHRGIVPCLGNATVRVRNLDIIMKNVKSLYEVRANHTTVYFSVLQAQFVCMFYLNYTDILCYCFVENVLCSDTGATSV